MSGDEIDDDGLSDEGMSKMKKSNDKIIYFCGDKENVMVFFIDVLIRMEKSMVV